MKKLILGVVGLAMLNVQAMATQEPSANASSTVANVKPEINFSTKVDTKAQDSEDPMKAKKFAKSFSLDQNDKINLSNTYGSMTIKVWDKNEIKVDVDIKAYANTDEEAQKLLDDVTIEATKTGDLVSFKTEVDSKNNRNSFWGNGTRNGKKWRRETKIHYTVYMPSQNSLTASQAYGNINLDNFAGPTSLKVQYGNLIAGNLANANNYISIQYGKGNIQNINQAKIRQQYGDGLTIASIGTIDLDAQYTSVNINTVKNSATIKHQYGNGVTIGSVGDLSINAQYTKLNVGKLHGNLTSSLQYSKLDVDQIEAGNNVDVNASYTGVKLGFASNYNGEFTVDTSYGSFKYGANVNAKKESDDRGYSTSKRYTGQIGKGGSAKVTVRTQYDSVTFN